MELKHLRTIERLSLVLGVVLCLASLALRRRDVVLGTVLGAGLATVNLYAIRRLVQAALASSTPRKRALLMSLLLGKMTVLIGLVYVIIRFAPVSVVAFIAGISTFLLSILLVSFFAAGGDATPDERPRRRRKRKHDKDLSVEPEAAVEQ